MIKNQPDFRRLRCTLLLEGEPDSVPLFDGVEPEVMSNWLGKPVSDLETTVEFYAKAGYDYIRLGVDLWSTLRGSKGGVLAGESKKVQYSVYTETHRERVWAREGKGIITSMKDFEDFLWPRVEDMDFSAFKKVEDYMPRGMKGIASVGHIFTTVWTLMGLETFCMALAENPELVAQIFQKVGNIQYEMLEGVIRFDSVGAILVSDDIAYTPGLMISPKYLRQYLFPWFERMCALCRERDVLIIYHSDGKLDDVLDDIAAVGFHGLHPIQPNAMDIKRVKERVGDRLCLLGNIDLDVLARGTPEQVEELVKKNLREIAPGGGYCVGSSNSVPNYVKLENYNAMRQTVFKYGTYPIQV
ncbi:uroporphyrinogen decarboxylase family protein [Chloroflexota bacterium]